MRQGRQDVDARPVNPAAHLGAHGGEPCSAIARRQPVDPRIVRADHQDVGIGRQFLEQWQHAHEHVNAAQRFEPAAGEADDRDAAIEHGAVRKDKLRRRMGADLCGIDPFVDDMDARLEAIGNEAGLEPGGRDDGGRFGVGQREIDVLRGDGDAAVQQAAGNSGSKLESAPSERYQYSPSWICGMPGKTSAR